MSDLPKIDRLLRVIGLLSGSRAYTKAEIATELGISERTVFRYIDSLHDSGFVVERDLLGYVRLCKDKSSNKVLHDLLHFSKEEAYILQRAIDAIDADNGLKAALVKKLYSVYDFKRIITVETNTLRSEIINTLVEAIEQKQQVCLCRYSSAQSASFRDRLVEPFDFTTNYKTLWAYDLEANCCKQFKLSRMQGVELLPQKWQFDSQHTPLISDVFGMSDTDYISSITIELSQRAMHLLIEEFPLSETYISALSADSWLLQCSVCKFEGAGRFVLGLPGLVRVRGSLEFIAYLRERAQLHGL